MLIKSRKTTLAKPRNNRKQIIARSLFLMFFLAFLTNLYASNSFVKVTRYTMESDKIHTPVRLAVISDLHSKKFSDNNNKLYREIAQSKPDLILMPGDMISKSHTCQEDVDYLMNFIKTLDDIAPVYYSLGNHEKSHRLLFNIKFAANQAGATVLEEDYRDIIINGNNLRLFGLSYYRSWDNKVNRFISDCLQTDDDVFSVLLCHNPEFYLWGIKHYPVDLTVSGHTHGGMVNIPLLGAVYAPEQGWFPDYAAGFYREENGYLAVTTGLGSSPEYFPRVFNRPQIMIIDVK